MHRQRDLRQQDRDRAGEPQPRAPACRQAHDLFVRAGDRRQALLAARELGWLKGLRGDFAGMEAAREEIRNESATSAAGADVTKNMVL